MYEWTRVISLCSGYSVWRGKLWLYCTVLYCTVLCSGYSVWRGKLGLELSRARLAAAQRDLARGDTRVTRWGDTVHSRAGNQPSRSFHNQREYMGTWAFYWF